MAKTSNFLTAKEEAEIIAAIRDAEKHTSGEIRIHIEDRFSGDIFTRARVIFHQLKMDTTQLRNGVLIYLAVKDRSFVIYGDQGIHEVVSENFWDTTRDAMALQFKKGNFKQGLIDGISKAGEQLQQYFPWHAHDKNELDDSISIG